MTTDDVTRGRHPRPAPVPVPLTALVGRDQQVAELAALLNRADVRLVTLTGPGGVGKTRLALQSASSAALHFPGGVWFVSLLPVTDPRLIAPSIAQALGMRDVDDAAIVDRLAALLGDRPTLLVLDNFEQVVEGAPLVVDLLAIAPALTVLVTSRVRLRLSGEHVYRVPPLGLPPEDADPVMGELSGAAAVRLFEQRAEAVNPDFALTEENALAIAEICRRLDGLPLAIELAAAWTKVLTASALLDRLGQRLPLLVGGSRDLPARQQTMETTIEWSYDLLPPDEQTLFRRLAVFVDGFTLGGAEAIAAATSSSVLTGVASLVEKSLLQPESEPDVGTRYRMLETVREFGLDRLAGSGEEEPIRRLHAAWHIDLAERTWQRLVMRVDKADLDALAREYGNLRAVLGWLVRIGDGEGLVRLAGALGEYWQFRGHRREGLEWLDRAFDRAQGADIPIPLRVRALHGASWLARDQGDLHRATALAHECLTLSQASNDPRDSALVPEMLGYAALAAGDYDRAAAYATEARARFDALGYRWLAAATITDLALATYGRGDIAGAETLLSDALDQFRQLDDAWYPQLILIYLGLVAIDRGNHVAAANRLAESLELWQRIGSRDRLTQWLATAATLAAASGFPEKSSRLFGAAEALRDAVGFAFALPERASFERGEDAAQSALAASVFVAARAAGAALSLEQAVDEAAALLASLVTPMHSEGERGGAGHAGLTPRETEVLRLLAAGRTDRQIADALFIGHRTVGTHVSRVLSKLGVASRVEAATWAIRHGIV